jgi:hypothetical protein
MGCSPSGSRTSSPPPAIEARFVLGSTPSLSLFDGIGHAPSCGTRLEPSAALSAKATSGGEEERRLVAAGRFTGRCGSRVLAFESVPVAKVGVVTSMSHDGLAPFEIDHAHPEWQVSLRATPHDAQCIAEPARTRFGAQP